MAYDTMPTRATGYMATADDWNGIGDNFDALTTIAFAVVFDGAGAVITTGTIMTVPIPVKCNISDAFIFLDGGYASDCRIAIHPWYIASASDFPPVASNEICTSDNSLIASTTTGQYASNALSSWTTGLAAGSLLLFNVDDCDLITKATVNFVLNRSS